MNKQVRKIRKQIKKRKNRINERDYSDERPNDLLPIIAPDEERYGLEQQLYYLKEPSKKVKSKQANVFLYRLIGSIALFLLTLIIVRTELIPLNEKWISVAFKEEFPFATVYDWYAANLGEPLSLTPNDQNIPSIQANGNVTPIIGDVVESFLTNGTGIKISPEDKTVVSAMQRGIVVFAGNDPITKKTVVIQHADRSLSTYGFLSTIEVHLYKYVQANETIGIFQPTNESETVFFSIEKENEFIDPTKVIRLVP